MTDHLAELASAYVDGEVTAEEAALVEADPAAMQLVAEFRSLAAENRRVGAASAEQRERHLAAAMAEFDAGFSGSDAGTVGADDDTVSPGAPTTLAPIRSLGRAQRSTWIGRVAAGVVIVGAIGLGLSQTRQASIDETSASAGSSVTTGAATEKAPAAAEAEISRDATAAGDAASADVAGAAESLASPSETTPSTTAADASGVPEFGSDLTPALIESQVELDPQATAAGDLPANCLDSLGLDRRPDASAVIDFGSVRSVLVVFRAPEYRSLIIGMDCAVLADQAGG